MATALLEVIELPTGEVVLRRADSSEGSSEPLVTIKFSEEAKQILGANAGDLGKTMIGVGLQIVAQLQQNGQEEEGVKTEDTTDSTSDSPAEVPKHRLH